MNLIKAGNEAPKKNAHKHKFCRLLNQLKVLTLIRLIACTISVRLVGRGTS